MLEAQVVFPLAGRRVWVAGHGGMVGRAIVRRLAEERCDIVTVPRAAVDLTRQTETEDWVAEARPDAIFLAAAKVGGILANDSRPLDFLYDNLMIEANVLAAAARAGTAKVLLLGSSCIYPKLAPQPIPEDALLTGPLEETNQWYAIAKIAGIKLTQAYRRQRGCDFISAMPTNLYGPFDNFDLKTAHVVPALIRKAHEARERGESTLPIWGTGAARREFLHVDDCAAALVHLMKTWSGEQHVNVGFGSDVTIAELAETVMDVVGLAGGIAADPTKPDGTPRKLLDSGIVLGLGWRPGIGLNEGLASTYRWFLEHREGARTARAVAG
jgi:GDP-L-fucose synthase